MCGNGSFFSDSDSIQHVYTIMAQVLVLFPSSVPSVPSFSRMWGSTAVASLSCTPVIVPREAPLESTHSLELSSVTRPLWFYIELPKSFSCSSFSLNTPNPGTQPRQLRRNCVFPNTSRSVGRAWGLETIINYCNKSVTPAYGYGDPS